MSRRFKLRDIPSDSEEDAATASYVIDRRGFLKSSFNAAAGLVTLAAGGVAFAATLMGTSEVDGGDSSVRFWVPTGAEDTVWYGTQHLEPMSYSSFVNAAAQSPTGISGAQGVWSGMPVNVVYVPHEENKNSAPAEGKPRFQYMDGYTAEGKYVGSAYEMEEEEAYSALSIHDNLIVVFSRCTHLCCIPGWQLVQNDYTNDTWLPGGTDSGGNKLFCICHSSRFDPTALEKNTNRNRSNGAEFEYFGIKRAGGPAPMGLPLIPYTLNGDVIEALPDYIDWYTYCD